LNLASSDGPVARPPLRDLPPFETLPAATLGWLEDEISWFALPGGEVLFSAGETPVGLYVVVSGAIGVVAATEGRGSELVAEIHAGETIGEMSLISGDLHSAGVIALRHSELFLLPRAGFDRLMAEEPGFIRWLTRLVVARLHRTTRHRPVPKEHGAVALVPLGAEAGMEALARGLIAALRAQGRGAYRFESDSLDQPAEWFDEMEEAHEVVLYQAPSADSAGDPWTYFCLRQADRIVLVARAGTRLIDPLPTPPSARAGRTVPIDLVLIEENGDGRQGSLPEGPERFATILHLRPGNDADLARIARHIAGISVGVVFAGGAARGFAHIGALEALHEARIPIDRVGGTSMGAIIAAGVAAGWDDREMRERMRAAFVDQNPLNDYTIPWIALFKGRSVDKLLQVHFGAALIEALWLPFFCVSTNLTRARAEVHRQGLLWRALRASVAIPGVLPPMLENRDVLVDGGVIDNFPVDVMAAGGRGPIIGIDVAGDRALMPGSEIPPRATPFLRLIRPRTPSMPGIVSVLSRVGTVSSQLQTALNRAQVTLLIEPRLENVPLLDWRAFDEAIEAGYKATIEAIKHANLDSLRPKSG
jgi:NTE family protein